MASFYNVARGNSDGRYTLNNNGISIGAETQQRPLLITLVSFTETPIDAIITWQSSAPVSILVIVLSVLGGVLLVALVIAVICIVRRRGIESMRVSS